MTEISIFFGGYGGAGHTARPVYTTDETKRAAGDQNVDFNVNAGIYDERCDWFAGKVARSDDLAGRRAGAILTMYDLLQMKGAVEKDKLFDVNDPNTVEYANRSSVWSNVANKRDTLCALPEIEKLAGGRNKAVAVGSMTPARDRVFESRNGRTRTLHQICYYGWREGGDVEQDGNDFIVDGTRYTRVEDEEEP